MDFRGRQRQLLLALEEHRADALLVTHMPNVRYLNGFTGSAGVLLAAPRALLFTDGRYAEQASEETHGAKVVRARGGLLAAAAEACGKAGLLRVGIEGDHLTVTQFAVLQKALGKGTRLVRLSGVVEELRTIKEPDEIELLREAVELSSGLFRPLLKAMRPGVTESEVAARLEFAARRAGAGAMSFTTIVAAGERSSLPHGVATRAPLPATGFVVLDYGVVVNGYCSDMTRTVHLGRAADEARSLYGAVLAAQLAALEAVHPGATCGEVDAAARKVLRRAKLEKYFTHSTGHGVGLEIHEPPRVAARAETVLQPGMVITIEPGVYLPGRYGVRVEDMVLVTASGMELLTPVTKELIELH